MNWQQLTGSSNSANDTPLHSYPASLSSQSSRDPSPASRFRNPVNSPPPTMPSQTQGSPTRHPTNDLSTHNTTHSKQEYVANSLNTGDHAYGSYPTQCRQDRTGESDTLQILGSLKETNSLLSRQTQESPSEMKQLRSQFVNSVNHQSTVASDSGVNRTGLIEQVNGPLVITNSRPTVTFSPQSSAFPATLLPNQETTSSETYQWGQPAKQLSSPTQQTSHPGRTQVNQQSPTQSILNAQQQPLNHTSQLSSLPLGQIRLQGQSTQAETSRPGQKPASRLSREGEHPPLSHISQRVQSPLTVMHQQPVNQSSYDGQLSPTSNSQNSPNRLPQLGQHFQAPSLQMSHQGHSQTSLPQPTYMIQTPLPQGSERGQPTETSQLGLLPQRNYQGQPSLAQISHQCQPTPVKNIQLQPSQALNYQGQPPQTNQLSVTSQAPTTQSQPNQNVSQRSTGQLPMQNQHAQYRGPRPPLTALNQHLPPVLTSTSYQTPPASTSQQVPPVSTGQVQPALSQISSSQQSHLGQPSRPQMHGHRALIQAQQSLQPQLNQFPPRPPAIPNQIQQPRPVAQPPHQYVNQQPINLPQLGAMQRPPLTGNHINQIAQPPPPTVSNHYGPAVQQYSATSRYPQYPVAAPSSPSYPTTARFAQQQSPAGGLASQMAGMNISQTGFNQLWGMDTFDLLKTRDILPPEKVEPPPIRLPQELYEAANCSSELFRCTLSKIPETKSLLDKSRLPLGVLIHPFKDLNELPEMLVSENVWPGSVPPQGDPYTEPGSLSNSKHLSVIQCSVIVRCRNCRTYINPFVFFIDNKRWKCNLCFRANELPDEFQYDPTTKTYGDPSRRPEIKSATIEFIAPSEYMVRPPQAAAYVFVLDVSRLGCECGYLESFSRTLLQQLDSLPGDARTSVALITFDSTVHFYTLTLDLAQPHQIVLTDIDDMFLPCPDNLLVNLSECQDQIRELVQQLPHKFKESFDTHSALGAALQAAYRLLAPTGGRVTVFTSCLPNRGPGSLEPREDPSQRAAESVAHLNPLTDFYKKLALDCSGQQIAVDLFLVNSQYIDLATISGVSKFSGGCMHHFPLFQASNPLHVDNLETVFARYLTRKIGFESVMRLRCSRGLSIHTFHGNFFVRSTDLLSLPNINPDAGFGMQVSIDENLSDLKTVCFQAALLYTSSKGERRIRVHTICLPIASNLPDVLHSADQQCIVGLLSKMAVDRCTDSSLSDAREAFVNAAADILSAYRITQSSSCPTGPLLAPSTLRLLPLYILALLKYVAFRTGQSTRLDDRVYAMCQMKSLPLAYLIQTIYPDLYPIHNLDRQPEMEVEGRTVPFPPRLHLSAERLDSSGAFLMDDHASIIIYVGHNISNDLCQNLFDVPCFAAIPQDLFSVPEVDSAESLRLRSFIAYLQSEKPYAPTVQIIREDSHHRMRFLGRLIEDKTESGHSYYDFLQRIKTLVK